MVTPAIMETWLKELDESKGQLTMDKAIPKLRDEITVVMMDRHRGNSRELAMALARLDEAHHWVVQYLQTQGALVIVPRAELLREVTTDITDKTVGNEASSV